MIRGLYTSASGMMAEMVRNDVSSNNLANVNTTGYKKDTALFRSFPEILLKRVNDQKQNEISERPTIGTLNSGAIVDQVITGYEQGQLRETSNPLDLAIFGDGFFVVQNPNGTFYTRNGSFTVDSQGYLVTSQGDYVMGQAGRISIGNTKDVVVDETGKISINGQQTNALRVVSFADNNLLTKMGDSLFSGEQPANAVGAQIKQKFVEASNVNVINEMVNMITIMRSYEANQKMLIAYDQTIAQALEVGRLK
jgi:flagellar basal-body rod protein FlgF